MALIRGALLLAVAALMVPGGIAVKVDKCEPSSEGCYPPKGVRPRHSQRYAMDPFYVQGAAVWRQRRVSSKAEQGARAMPVQPSHACSTSLNHRMHAVIRM